MVFDPPSAEPLQVLVVEHRAPVAARLKGQLESLGHRVLGTARAGREAVAAAQRLDPNLVFVEAKLPGLDGIETTRAIVTERPVPVILIARYATAPASRARRTRSAPSRTWRRWTGRGFSRPSPSRWNASESSRLSGRRGATRARRRR